MLDLRIEHLLADVDFIDQLVPVDVELCLETSYLFVVSLDVVVDGAEQAPVEVFR